MRDDKNKLQEKLEATEAEFLQLRAANLTLQGENWRLTGKLSGLNVVRSLLKEKEAEIKKLNLKLFQVDKD